MKRTTRSGIRMRDQGGNPEVRRALVRFLRWLRREYEFPVRVPVYLYPAERLITRHGETASASFFAPFDRNTEPYIRIATGDYRALKARRGRDNALAAYLGSLAHEVIHYQTWVNTGKVSEHGVVRAASALVRRYSYVVRRP